MPDSKTRSPLEILNTKITLKRKEYNDYVKKQKQLHSTQDIKKLPENRKKRIRKLRMDYEKLVKQRNRMAHTPSKPDAKPSLPGIKEEQLDTMEGGGIMNFVRQVIGGRDQLDRVSMKRLNKFRDSEIEKVWINREPINSKFTSFLNVVTLGKFKKEMLKSGHDSLFHLSVIVNLKGGGILLKIEKNDAVKISRIKSMPKGETREIPVTDGLMFGKAYDNTISGYPNKKVAHSYDSITNNCQRFVKMYLTRNPQIKQTAEDIKFVSQDLKWLIKNFPFIGPLAKVATDIGAKIGIVLTGGSAGPLTGLSKKQISANTILTKRENKISPKMKGQGICASKQCDDEEFTDLKDVEKKQVKAEKKKELEEFKKKNPMRRNSNAMVIPLTVFQQRDTKQKGGRVALPQAIGRAGNPIISGHPMPQVQDVMLGPVESVGAGIMRMREITKFRPRHSRRFR